MCERPTRHRPNRARAGAPGFTLVELVVVVAILVTALSMMVNTLSGIGSQAFMNGKYKVEIEFYGDQDLDRLLGMLKK